MFDPFFCDHINGFDLYSENPEDEPQYSYCSPAAPNPRYFDGVKTTYEVYGVKLQKTKKATLYQLVTKKKKDGFSYKYEYALGPKKWLPNSVITSHHISEFDATDVDFAEEFVVTGIPDLCKISIPSWLKSKDETLRTVFSIKNMGS
jgi:hypothetical protein